MTAPDNKTPTFDVTTPQGLHEAKKIAAAVWNWTSFGFLFNVLFPRPWQPSDISPAKQAEAAKEIIEAAAAQGAKRVKVKIDKSVGAKLKGNVGEGIVIGANIGEDGKMELEIDF